jgi:hypothetical protein
MGLILELGLLADEAHESVAPPRDVLRLVTAALQVLTYWGRAGGQGLESGGPGFLPPPGPGRPGPRLQAPAL